MGRLCLTANNIGLNRHYCVLHFGCCHSYYSPVGDSELRKAPVLFGKWLRGVLRNTQLWNIIKGLKIKLKYKLQSQLNTLYLRYKARNQTVMFDADYLLQIRTERKTDQILLQTQFKCTIWSELIELIRQLSISLSSICLMCIQLTCHLVEGIRGSKTINLQWCFWKACLHARAKWSLIVTMLLHDNKNKKDIQYAL